MQIPSLPLRVLRELAASPTEFVARDWLAGRLGVSPSTLSVAIRRLEAQGYVQRKVGMDARTARTGITHLGRRVLADQGIEGRPG